MRLLQCGVLSLIAGCAITPREPYVWRDDAPPVGVHRADVARAEGRVIEHLVSSGTLDPPGEGCGKSARAYQVITVETETAYEVRVVSRPGLCEQAPEDTTLPPLPWGIYDGPMVFAVSKKDFHIIRERFPGDPAVPLDSGRPEPQPPGNAPDAPPVSALAFATPSLSIPVGTCAGPVGVETRAASGSRQAVTEPVTLNLAAVPPSGVFFSDAKCTTAITSINVAGGTSSAEVYFLATQVGPLQVTASATKLSAGSQTHTVTPARAVAVAFTTPPQAVARGACSSAVTVQARDAFENPASVAVEIPVQLLATPARSITFYARSDCTGATITRVNIPANDNSASFYFKGRLPQTVAISASLGTGDASQEAVITAAQPTPSNSTRQSGR